MALPTQTKRPLPDGFLDALRGVIDADRLSQRPADLDLHGRGECWHPSMPPDVIAYATSTTEVAALVKLAVAHGVAVVGFGAGTSLEGHTAAIHGGLCIDLSRMNAIFTVRPEDMDCTVEAGVTRKQLNTHLRDTGLFFPVDPGADATLGGMAATRASGTSAVRYGTMRENVLNLTVVLPDGQIVRTASRARKSSAGYDLTRLFVGSEGTLGIITEVSVRLQGIPETTLAAVCAFPNVESAVTTASEVVQLGVQVGKMEFVNTAAIRAVNAFDAFDYAESPTLFFEFSGADGAVREQAELVRGLAADNGGTDFRWAETPEDRTRLWHARHEFHYALMAQRPGSRIWGTDVCVPISGLTECILLAEELAAEAPFPAASIGHVGDGNFHTAYLIDPNDPDELARAEELAESLARRAIALDGTCTGEHGVGYGKAKYMEAEFGDAGLSLMRMLKTAIDPSNLMNPGKILPHNFDC